MRASHLSEAFAPDRVEETCDCSVEERVRRRLGLQPEINPNAVPLVGPDAQAVVAEGESLLVVGRDNRRDLIACEDVALLLGSGDEGVDFAPPGAVERDRGFAGLVTEHEAEESAQLVRVHGEWYVPSRASMTRGKAWTALSEVVFWPPEEVPMWYAVGAVGLLVVVGIVVWFFRRSGRDAGMVSIVILRRSPRRLTEADVRGAYRRAFGKEPKVDSAAPHTDVRCMVLLAEGSPPIAVLDSTVGYMSKEEAEDTAARCEHPDVRRALVSHTAWVSIDAAGLSARGIAKESLAKVHALLGKLAAEFIDDDSLLLFRPYDNRVGRADGGAAELLASGQCDAAFQDDDMHTPVSRVSGDDKAVNAAMAEAVSRIPEFLSNWRAASAKGPTLVKGRFRGDDGSNEYIWCSVVDETDAGFRAKIENNPIAPNIAPKGTVVEIKLDDIVDWVYVNEKNEPVGLFVDRALGAVK